MNSRLITGFALTLLFSSACAAQEWEIGGLAGFGWYYNATVTNPTGSASAGFEPKFALGVVVDQNLYNYIGGEFRYMYIAGRPTLKFNGLESNTTGYTNVVHYDMLVHTSPKESTLRPFFAAGAGIKVYSGTNINFNQPLSTFAVLRKVNQVEPLISVGGGLKYMFTKSAQFRVDFRTYFTPAPNVLFTPIPPATIHGWVYNFVPAAGFSWVF